MSVKVNETNEGSYTEPFSQTQYGVFVLRDGNPAFIAASVADWTHAVLLAYNYLEGAQDYYGIDPIAFVRSRTVTYAPWDI